MSKLEVRRIDVSYAAHGHRRADVPAVRDVSFVIGAGEILGLVGESGCGKTTIGRAILGLVPLAGGTIAWHGRRIDNLAKRDFRALRKELQLVFQDPAACFDPRMTVAESVAEPVRALMPQLDARARGERAARLLAEVGLGNHWQAAIRTS
jgi:ABC-type glutathione transport system ATPase component